MIKIAAQKAAFQEIKNISIRVSQDSVAGKTSKNFIIPGQ